MESDGFLTVLSNESTSDIAASGPPEPIEVDSEATQVHIQRRGEVTWSSENALVHGREVVRGHFALEERVQSARNVSPPVSFSTSVDLQGSFEQSLLINTSGGVRGSDQGSVVWPSKSSEREKAHEEFTRSFDLIPRGKMCQWAIQSRPESKDLPESSELRRDHGSGDEGGGEKEGRRRASDGSKGGASSPFETRVDEILPLTTPSWENFARLTLLGRCPCR